MIVLSITILVMAILAATAIIALEDTGIIGRSKSTVSKQNYTQEYERLIVIKNGILTDNLGEITVDEYITELSNKGLIESGVTTNSDGSKTVTTKTGFVANVSQDGESNLIISLGESNSTIALSPVSITGDITDGVITKTITASTTNVSGDITWTTSNASIATVTGTNTGATVTLKGVGTATITATYGAAKASCAVTVTGTTPTISLNKTSIVETIESGSTSTVTLTATTANISGTLTWSSSNTSVTTVSGSGNTATVTLKAGGTAVITASYGTTSASCTVTVTETEPEPLTVSVSSAIVDPTHYTYSSAELATTHTVTLTTTLNKSVSDAQVKVKYTFYELYYATSTYGELSDSTIETTTKESTVTATLTYEPNYASQGEYVRVKITVLDVSDNILAEYYMDDATHGYAGAMYTYSVNYYCLPADTLVTVEVEEEDENGKKRKRRKKKKIEDLTYEDDLVVWDFDNGCFTTAKALWLKEREYAEEYNLLKFSDGSELKTIRQHRIFNKELGKFTYPMSDETPLGTVTFNELGEEVTLVSKEVVTEPVAYYNVISEYHMNVFAEGILTSCRLSNLYEIKDMKYVKDDRELASESEFKGIPEEYIKGLRLLEQLKEVNRGLDDNHGNTLKDYVNNLIRTAKKK